MGVQQGAAEIRTMDRDEAIKLLQVERAVRILGVSCKHSLS